MVNAPHLSLKIILVAHLVLSVWAAMTEEFLPTAYIYSNAFMLAFGVWAIAAPESVDSILLFMILNIVNVVMDIIFLGIFTAHPDGIRAGLGTYRFSLGMAIVNLLLRPFSTFVLYRLYQDRGGMQTDFGIPGFNPSGGGGHTRGYEDIDQPVPSATDNSYDPSSPSHSPDAYKTPMP